MFARFLVAAAGLTLAGSAFGQLIHNPSFEIPGPLGAEGWQPFNESRYRTATDGLLPAVTPRTGDACVELPGGGNSFQGFTTNTLNPITLEPFNPTVPVPTGDVTVSGWYMIPADRPLVAGNATIKLEFFNFDGENQILYAAFEDLSINGHTNGLWVQYTNTISADLLNPECGEGPNRVAVLPIMFGPGETGTIFWDDLELTIGPTPCTLEGDLNGDNVVDVFDLLFYLDIWFVENGQSCPP